MDMQRSRTWRVERGLLALVAISCATSNNRGPARSPAGAENDSVSTVRSSNGGEAAERPHGLERAPPRFAGTAEVEPYGDGDVTSETPATVRAAVSGVVSARGLPAYGIPRALRAIAGLLEGVGGGASPAAESIGRMRREVATLERLGAVDLDRADRVKAALADGVEAMRALARRRAGTGSLDAWVEAAATAVNAIDPATPLGLQRAAVQDALRSLADAVLMAAQLAGS
jgi:hypothetical protein